MKPINIALAILFLISLSACAPTIQNLMPRAKTPLTETEISQQVATMVAGALRQTEAARATPSPFPVPNDLPQVPVGSKRYQSSALKIQFDYPENWYLQETVPGLPNAILVASFDPAKPPHKLEWTPQTMSIQFQLLPVASVPPTLDAWVESAKKTAAATQMDIFEQRNLLIVNQPAVRLTLVSGSGGVIHQVRVFLNENPYEIDVEGNFDLAKNVFDTLQPFSSTPLKLPDSDSPAAGICGEPQEDPVAIVLGTGPDGLPKAGRCIAVSPQQTLDFINQSDTVFNFKLPGITIELPPGKEMLLEKPSGAYFAAGVHFLPMGPELWIKGKVTETVPAATQPGPLRHYENPELGYAVTLPTDWNVDDHGLSTPNKEVLFSPRDSTPFVAYLSISLDSRSLDEIQNAYAQNIPDAVKDNVVFNGQAGIKFTHGMRIEFYIPYSNRILRIASDQPDNPEVQLVLMSIRLP